ncbi:MAG: hypothetical protein U9Q67_01520 [Patescibacteria group bacterium]|nr:hypothetical protein [Patescibacteria group bacterium]
MFGKVRNMVIAIVLSLGLIVGLGGPTMGTVAVPTQSFTATPIPAWMGYWPVLNTLTPTATPTLTPTVTSTATPMVTLTATMTPTPTEAYSGELDVSHESILNAGEIITGTWALSLAQVRVVAEVWDLVLRICVEEDLDPFLWFAIFGGENSLRLYNDRLGIMGFYSLVSSGVYTFTQGPLAVDDLPVQVVLGVSQIKKHCPNQATSFCSYLLVGEDSMWERADCYARYYGSYGGRYVRGEMDTAAIVFNNHPEYPGFTGMQMGSLGQKRNDGYETYYRKVLALINLAADLEAAAAAPPAPGEP